MIGGGGGEDDVGSGGGRQGGGGLTHPTRDARARPDELDRDIADLITGRAHAPRRLGEENAAGRSSPLRLGGSEVGAEIPQPRGGEKSIAAGMGDDVAIGVAFQPGLAGPRQARQPQRLGRLRRGEGVYIDADTGTGQERRRRHRYRRPGLGRHGGSGIDHGAQCARVPEPAGTRMRDGATATQRQRCSDTAARPWVALPITRFAWPHLTCPT